MTKNRTTLKGYFVKGAIPTETNFADLIDSMLNQDDDNISKLPGDPLRITASGVDENLLNFYRVDQSVETLTWQIKQKPGGEPGLSIGDATASHLFIESGTGNVGIGTTSPTEKLQFADVATNSDIRISRKAATPHVASNVPSLLALTINDGAESGVFIVNERNGANTFNNQYIRFNTHEGNVSVGERMRIAPNGNVGIGTTSPVSRLHIHGNYANDGKGGFVLDASDIADPEKFVLRINPFVLGPGKVGYQFQTKSIEGGTNTPLTFDNAGNVGIGTIAPTAKLEVNGNLKVGTGTSSFAGNVGIGTSSPNKSLTIRAIGTSEELIGFENPLGNTKWHINQNLGGNNPGLNFAETGVADGRFFIKTGGNVGIGTTTPTAKLEVNGDIQVTGRIIQEAWKEIGSTGVPAFQNGWTNYDTTFNTAGYFKDSQGIVHLKGLVKNGVNHTPIFTLPVGYRPVKQELHVVQSWDQVGRLDIATDGGIWPAVVNTGWVSLDGVTFRAITGTIFVPPIVAFPPPIVTLPR